MREAAEPAYSAVRSVAQIFGRVDMAYSLVSSVNLADSGKIRVNRSGPLLAESTGPDQARPR
jgi:hypothetical protein